MADPTYFLGVVLLASAFPLAKWSSRLTSKHKRRWEALSAGVAVAYMFVCVLPDLAEHQPTVAVAAAGSLLNAEKRIYIWALAGFITFAGLSEVRLVRRGHPAHSETGGLIYWSRMTGFALYVLLIGYLMVHREDHSRFSLWIYVTAMGLHLFMLDVLVSSQFRTLYEKGGRLMLMAVVFVGWLLGTLNAFPEGVTSRLFAFILGGVTITSAHEEIGVEKTGRFWWFVAGAAVYAMFLLLI